MEDELKKLSKEILGINENDNRYSINSRLKYLSKIYGNKGNIKKILIMGINPAGADSSYDEKYIGFIPNMLDDDFYEKIKNNIEDYKNYFNINYFRLNYNLFSNIEPMPKMTWGIDNVNKGILKEELKEKCNKEIAEEIINSITEDENDENPRLIFVDLIYYHQTDSKGIKKTLNNQYKCNSEFKQNVFNMLDKHIEMFNPSMIVITNAYVSNLIYSLKEKENVAVEKLTGEMIEKDVLYHNGIPIVLSGMVSRGNMDNYSYYRLKNRIKEIYDDVKNK